MVLHKNISFRSVSLLVLALLCIIALGSLFVAYQSYQEGHISYQENAGKKTSPETIEKNENGYQWIENLLNNTLSTPSASSVEYLNIMSYSYIINESNKCKEESPFVIILIATIASEVENRRAIRATFGKKTLKNGSPIICMFLLGTDSKQEPNSILEESEKYHDIIQKDFQDTYKNLTIKTLMGIEWVCKYCPTTKYVMKTDSDMFVNIDRLLDILGSEQPQNQNYFTGYLMEYHRPHRNEDSKWYMPHSLYAGEFYPSYCTGAGYVFSGDVAPKILRSSFKVKYLYLEDVFVGMCLDREGIMITRPPTNNLFNNYHVVFDPCVYNKIITSHDAKSTQLINYWIIVQENKERCSNSQQNE